MSGDEFHNGPSQAGHGESRHREPSRAPKPDPWPSVPRDDGPRATITYQVMVHGQWVDVGSADHLAAMQRKSGGRR
jgi:hypothetical protein